MDKKPITKSVEPVSAQEYSWQELLAGDFASWLKIWKSGWTEEQGIKVKDILKLIWSSAGLRATLIYRLSYQLQRKQVRMLPGILSRLNITLHGFDVPSRVEIGPGLYVPHPVGTVIMAERIGSNLSLISSITIGMRHEQAFPRIGDNVFIGAGARVLGKIVIGDNVNIGANAVVLQDIPSNCTAVGIPAKVYQKSIKSSEY